MPRGRGLGSALPGLPCVTCVGSVPGLLPSAAVRKAAPGRLLGGLPLVLFLRKRVLRDVETAELWPS